ncbi:hypothetical protein JRI60_28520 [Archangium violaceum]|uniref:hypothetical protein n=1 Tax=Archangium violaceum TaxID=83451 RepID=UPI00194FD656|nr:hypothetical protein [Archangium violaceum]QRN93148.1 hypothetical protein JRI60_28520 [Archangium violaceum]UQK84943.1 hypothetical protein [Archangium gephyra]
MSRCLTLLLVLGLLVPGAVLAADEQVDPEVSALRASYEYGRYAEVLERASSRIDRGRLSDNELAELHKLAGLSAFHLNRSEDSARHFRALLRVEPDFNLDPFAVPPPAVAWLDSIREQMSAELDLVRQERRLRVERERAETERERVATEERRRRVEELARQVTVREVEKRSYLVNFMPFGAGQFQQGRTSVGTLLAATEGALAVTSILSFFAYNSLIETGKVTVDAIGGPKDITYTYIPTSRKPQALVWKWLKWGSAGGFYAVYAAGVIDSLRYHQDQVVQTHIETLPLAPQPAPPAARLNLHPTPGGAGVGFTLAF